MDLINTLETPGEFDALSNLRPGEPYFLLVGRDSLAPPLVQQWAEANRKRSFADYTTDKIDRDQLEIELRKSTQAEEIGWSMAAYKRDRFVAAKPPPPARILDTGRVRLPPDAALRARIQSANARALAALNNAVAEVYEYAELITGNADHDPQPAILIVGEMRDAVERLTPARPGL